MKFEFSAGGIVFKRGTTQKDEHARNYAEKIYILVSQHSQHHGWVFPKGLIGDVADGTSLRAGRKETKEEAAVREVKEETGIEAEIIESLPPVSYWYQWEKEKRKKTVYYYIMKYVGGDFSESDEEMEAIEWIHIDQVMERLTYRSDKETFKAARPRIEILAKTTSG